MNAEGMMEEMFGQMNDRVMYASRIVHTITVLSNIV
jgi:hypothetical protein